MKLLARLAVIAATLFPSLCLAQGTLPIALTQQFSFTNCATFTNACGTPLIGGSVYFYQAGTATTPQDSFQDAGLTIKNQWPLLLDGNARVPKFFLASGSVHVVLRDVNNVSQFDVDNMLVIGPAGGGGGGGGVDPTTVSSTGDIKFRATSEFVTGWVKLNGQTIGGAASGASQRANADTLNLYLYLWANCPDTHCPVTSGRGGSASTDFTANKQITLPDLRGRGLAGLDDMGNTAAGRILAANITSGGGDTVTTANATGGEANHALTVAELAAHNHTANVTDPGHAHTYGASAALTGGGTGFFVGGPGSSSTTNSATTGITVATVNAGSGTAHNNMPPFMLGTWYVKL